MKEKFKLNLSFGWKGHIIQFHLEEFLNKIQKPLGFFAEPTSESVHKNMKKTLSSFVFPKPTRLMAPNCTNLL